MGKLAYSWHIQRDSCIPDTIVRCSTIPEELGRVEYFLTDKTGTLTKNEMVYYMQYTEHSECVMGICAQWNLDELDSEKLNRYIDHMRMFVGVSG